MTQLPSSTIKPPTRVEPRNAEWEWVVSLRESGQKAGNHADKAGQSAPTAAWWPSMNRVRNMACRPRLFEPPCGTAFAHGGTNI